jgi:hypothetical protein
MKNAVIQIARAATPENVFLVTPIIFLFNLVVFHVLFPIV